MKDGRCLDDGYSAPRKSSEVMYMMCRELATWKKASLDIYLVREGKKAQPALLGCKCEVGHSLLRIAAV